MGESGSFDFFQRVLMVSSVIYIVSGAWPIYLRARAAQPWAYQVGFLSPTAFSLSVGVAFSATFASMHLLDTLTPSHTPSAVR